MALIKQRPKNLSHAEGMMKISWGSGEGEQGGWGKILKKLGLFIKANKLSETGKYFNILFKYMG